jgi:hypothetical protein
VQATGREQHADDKQQQAQGQVDSSARLSLALTASAWMVSTSSRPIVRATVIPPSRTHKNIALGRRFSISSRSRASSLGFSAEANASAKNSAFIAARPYASSPRPVRGLHGHP